MATRGAASVGRAGGAGALGSSDSSAARGFVASTARRKWSLIQRQAGLRSSQTIETQESASPRTRQAPTASTRRMRVFELGVSGGDTLLAARPDTYVFLAVDSACSSVV